MVITVSLQRHKHIDFSHSRRTRRDKPGRRTRRDRGAFTDSPQARPAQTLRFRWGGRRRCWAVWAAGCCGKRGLMVLNGSRRAAYWYWYGTMLVARPVQYRYLLVLFQVQQEALSSHLQLTQQPVRMAILKTHKMDQNQNTCPPTTTKPGSKVNLMPQQLRFHRLF